jgi:preprotein translocase subunit SecY
MNKLVTTIRNIFAIEDLRVRILNTLLFLAVFRLGSFIVLPGVDRDQLGAASEGILGLIDTFVGGAYDRASIFALGIMPYISASIALQLLTVAVPYFQKLQKEGDSGRKKINQYTRVLTIAFTIAQSIAYLAASIPAEAIMIDRVLFSISSVIILTSGTVFCMWLGEKITDKGIGNGISMLIMIGIISRFPLAIYQEATGRGMGGALIFIAEIVILFFVVMGVVMLTQAIRQIPVQYAKQVIGNKVYGGQRQYIPIKVNSAGVMPIIFAQSLMFLPALLMTSVGDEEGMIARIGQTFANPLSWQYNLLFTVLIIVFTYFYTAISINPNQIAEDMKRNGGFIPGIKPGLETSDYIAAVIDRITLPGAIFLAVVAFMPAIASAAGVTREFSQFFGGTSLLIMVGVILDTLQQIESYLQMKQYDSMMKSNKLKGRSRVSPIASAS